ncbi:MAG: hypothetical protein ABII95_03350 [Patescibacteria group bacterium]
MKAYRKISKLGKVNIPILDIRPTQFQIYLDKIYNHENEEGILGLIRIILNGDLIVPSLKQDHKTLINRRKNKYFSDLVRLVILKDNFSIYVVAGTHRLIALWLANQLYKTRDYLDVKEYDLAKIKDLDQFGQWRKDEFIFQKIKGSDVGEPYKEFDIEKYQKGFDNQFTAEYGGKRIFIERCVNSWKELFFKNKPFVIKRLNYLINKNLIKNKKDILVARDIINKIGDY